VHIIHVKENKHVKQAEQPMFVDQYHCHCNVLGDLYTHSPIEIFGNHMISKQFDFRQYILQKTIVIVILITEKRSPLFLHIITKFI
jgi:hypothetical protein